MKHAEKFRFFTVSLTGLTNISSHGHSASALMTDYILGVSGITLMAVRLPGKPYLFPC